MRVDILDFDVFTALDPHDIESYLLHNAWQCERVEHGYVSVWSKIREGERYRVWVPLDYKLGDFAESTARAIKMVALAENLSQLSVLEDFDTIAIGDVVRFKSFDNLNKNSSSLLIHDGISLLEQAKNLLTAGANSAHQTRPVHPARKNNVVINYVNKLRLGQTERGSYIIKLVSPLDSSSDMPLPGIPAPSQFARNAVVTLLGALNTLRAVSEDNFKREKFIFELFEEAVPNGVSANLCEAVAQNSLSQYRPLEVAVSWSFKLGVTNDLPTSVEIPTQYMQYIAQAAQVFREKNPEEYRI